MLPGAEGCPGKRYYGGWGTFGGGHFLAVT
jgi:hypothetical protein